MICAADSDFIREVPLERFHSISLYMCTLIHSLLTLPRYFRASSMSCDMNIQWNLSIVDTSGTQLAVLYTVEPLYRGHQWDLAGCPVYSGTSL